MLILAQRRNCKYMLFLTNSMLHNKVMYKRKAQVVIFFTNDSQQKEFLLLKTNERRGFFWQSVTGSIEEGESYEDGALREAMEETGLDKKIIERFQDLHEDFDFHDQWGADVKEKVFFIELKNKFPIKIDPKEHSDFKWVEANKINDKSVKYITNYKAIKKCIDLY
jgi:dihydroneopterin triphosphate diphosphatase